MRQYASITGVGQASFEQAKKIVETIRSVLASNVAEGALQNPKEAPNDLDVLTAFNRYFSHITVAVPETITNRIDPKYILRRYGTKDMAYTKDNVVKYFKYSDDLQRYEKSLMVLLHKESEFNL
jgi:hypothetical protein